MKKFLLYFFVFLFICFFLPAILTKTKITLKSGETFNNNEQKEEQNSENSQSVTEIMIKLLHKKTGIVEDVNLEQYLCNVVSAEMPADYELEALKAQAIVARTYTMYKINNKKHENADICDTSTCCQAWIAKEDRLARWEEDRKEMNWQKIEQCVNKTNGKIIVYQNEPINAFFHSNSGGITEVPKNVWGGTGFPYLQVVETSGEEGYAQYASEVELSYVEITNKIKEKYADILIDFNNDEEVQILSYTDSGRVKTIKFGNHELSGVEARAIFGLKSANFEIIKGEGKIKFKVKGYGHGVGMSQTGADALAKQGYNAEEIIHHFYQNVEIKSIN